MTPRDLAVLDALRQDRDESGPGLSKTMVEEIGATRFADGLIVRLGRQGPYAIGVVGGLFQLGEEPDIESDRVGSSDEELALSNSSDRSAHTVALDATQPSLFPASVSHYAVEREAA